MPTHQQPHKKAKESHPCTPPFSLTPKTRTNHHPDLSSHSVDISPLSTMESVLNSYHPPIDWSEGYSPHSQTNSRIDETGWPLSPRSPSQTNPQLPESKRDKKRRETNDRLTALNTEFLLSREQNFRATLQKLQAELTALHEGGNREFLDRVEVLEDARDKELVQIEAGRGYALLRAEREYQDEMRRAEEDYVVCVPHFSGSG